MPTGQSRWFRFSNIMGPKRSVDSQNIIPSMDFFLLARAYARIHCAQIMKKRFREHEKLLPRTLTPLTLTVP